MATPTFSQKSGESTAIPQPALPLTNIGEYQAIISTMQHYIDGGRSGQSHLMRPAFHPNATIVGYCGGLLLTGPIQQLFDWIDHNGPAPNIHPLFASVEVVDTVAVVRLEVKGWSGKMAGENASMSDIFTLLKMPEGWCITQKTFHWHTS
jgi:hypothetical protein